MEGASTVNKSMELGVEDPNLAINGVQEEIGGQRSRKSDGGSRKSSSHKSNPSRKKKEIEATRDAEILRIKKGYAEKLRSFNKLKVLIRQDERSLKKIQDMRDTAEWTEDLVKKEIQISEHLAELQDEEELLRGDLRFIEGTFKEEIAAINSKAEEQIAQYASDEEYESASDDENGLKSANQQPTSSPKPVPGNLKPCGDPNCKLSGCLQNAPVRNQRDMEMEYVHQQQGGYGRYYQPPGNRQQNYGWGPRVNGPDNREDFGNGQFNSRRRAQQTPPQPPPTTTGNEVVDSLVAALGKAFGGAHREVIIKSSAEKELPKFNGNPALWGNFRSEYNRTAQKYKLDDSENLSRLRKSLEGDALKAVEHLMSTPHNVKKIWEVLEKRFGRPEFILDYLVDRCRATKSPESNNPESLIAFGTAIEALMVNVCAYDQYDYMYNKQLVNELVRKLPVDLQTKWYGWLEKDSERRPILNFFSEWLTKKVNVAILAVKPKMEIHDDERKQRSKRGPGAVHSTSGDESEKKCYICNKTHHFTGSCWKLKKMTLDQRWEKVKEFNLCVCCLKPGHRSNHCKEQKKCSADGCERNHHGLLHTSKSRAKTDKPEEKKEAKSNEDSKNEEKKTDEAIGKHDGSIAVISGCDGPLAIVPVKVKGPSGVHKMYAFLDNGASRSLILKEAAQVLGLEGKATAYSYNGISGAKVSVEDAKMVECKISGGYRGAQFHKLYATVTVDEIPLKPYSIDVGEIKRKYPYLKKARCGSLMNVVPDIIIGNNNPKLWLPRESLSGGEGEPIGWRSVLGWTISGNFDDMTGMGSINVAVGEGTDEHLHQLIKQSFTTEHFGVVTPKLKGNNLEEKRAYNILEATTKKLSTQWETGLLWKEDRVQYPPSYNDAYKRLLSQERRMRDPEFGIMYKEKFEELKAKGYIVKLSAEEAQNTSPKTRYIAHFGVTNVNKPGKLRLVLDAAAKSGGVSMNDKLMKGPDLIRPLTGVLWNFRKHAIAITGDIADMFHRVMVREEDHDCQRLLWRDGDVTRDPDHYKMVVLIFGATSSPSTAIYVKNTNAGCYEQKFPEAVEKIIRDCYVDDILTGASTPQKAIELRKEISMINEQGGFIVRKWMSNSPDVLASIPEDLKVDGVKDFEEKDLLPVERVLGMWWEPNNDYITFKLNMHKVSQDILNGQRPTKREVSRLVMSIFDPIGLVNHFKVKGLMILQEIWRSGVGWDDEIPTSIYENWQKFLAKLPEIVKVNVPRHYSSILDDYDTLELHTFCDASEESFCAVTYLRVERQGDIHVALIGSRIHVAPLKKLTIPKLELQGAVLGNRLANKMKEELQLKFTSIHYWVDSKTVLLWIRANAIKYKEFVANRIGEIQENSDIHSWKWIPTAINVADVATRFSSEISFSPDFVWFRGPDFLYGGVEGYPVERVKEESCIAATMVELAEDEPVAEGMNYELKATIPTVERFSSYIRLLRATAAVKKAALFWKWKAAGRKGEKQSSPWAMEGSSRVFQSHLSADEILNAELQLIKVVQKIEFGMEMALLKKDKPLPKSSRLRKLSPGLEADILRIRGRIGAAKDVEDSMKQPIILPSKCHFTELLVDHEHRVCAHQGVETVLSNLRKNYWIIDGRQTVKRSWTRCLKCRMGRAKPVIPEMGNLPHYRLAIRQPCFAFTGLDFFGPLEVTVGRHREKRWGVIFCCMTTRAVHLEITHGLSTDEAMMAVSRFVDTRGRPQVICSDNGTNLVGAANELKKALKELDFNAISVNGKFHKIDWKFIPPAAPHMGGAWERLIQSVKKCMYAILKEKAPKDTTLLTTFKEVENIMNSRPLTYLSSDPHDPAALTPNHLLRGGSDSGSSIPAAVDPDAEYLRNQWKRSQLFTEQFWNRWKKEYLPRLVPREKWHTSAEPLQQGDLVFLINDQAPRNTWQRGFISAVFPGADGQIRVVEVTTADKDGTKAIFRRPVVKVIPLGLRMKD